MKRIVDDLYIGTWPESQDMDPTIEAVLNLRRVDYQPKNHVKAYIQVPWMYIDDPNHMDKLEQAVDFVIEQHEKLGHTTFIHCQVGVDRTVGVALCYLMYKGLTYGEARKFMADLNLELPRDSVPEVLAAVQEYGRRFEAAR